MLLDDQRGFEEAGRSKSNMSGHASLLCGGGRVRLEQSVYSGKKLVLRCVRHRYWSEIARGRTVVMTQTGGGRMLTQTWDPIDKSWFEMCDLSPCGYPADDGD